MAVAERKKPEEAPSERVAVFLKDTEEWLRNSVFRNMPRQDVDRCMQNLGNALAQDKPRLLYEGVKDDLTRTMLGVIYNMLSGRGAEGIYRVSVRQRNEFFEKIEAYEKTAAGRSAMMLSPATEKWLKDQVFWDSGKDKTELYLRNLNNALRERMPILLYAGLDAKDDAAKSTLGRLYNMLTEGGARKGTYSLTEGKKDEFLALMEASRQPQEKKPEGRRLASAGALKVSFEDEAAKVAEKAYVKVKSGDAAYLIEFDNPAKLVDGTSIPSSGSLTALALNYGGQNAKVIKLAADGSAEAVFDMSDIRKAQELSRVVSEEASVAMLSPPQRSGTAVATRSTLKIEASSSTFYVETPRLSKDEVDLYRRIFKALSPADAVSALLQRADTKAYVANGSERSETTSEAMLALIRLEKERLVVTHREGKMASA